MEMLIVSTWVIVSLIVAVVANGKGRSGVGFFFLSLITSPIIALIILLVVGEGPGPLAANSSARKCPYCAELVKKEAIVCKHCGKDLPVLPAMQAVGAQKETASEETYQEWLKKNHSLDRGNWNNYESMYRREYREWLRQNDR